jgi:hypothetical protein
MHYCYKRKRGYWIDFSVKKRRGILKTTNKHDFALIFHENIHLFWFKPEPALPHFQFFKGKNININNIGGFDKISILEKQAFLRSHFCITASQKGGEGRNW